LRATVASSAEEKFGSGGGDGDDDGGGGGGGGGGGDSANSDADGSRDSPVVLEMHRGTAATSVGTLTPNTIATDVDLAVLSVQIGHWPSAARQTFVGRDALPSEVALATRKYEREAATVTTGMTPGTTDCEPRKYLWCADLGQADVEVRFSAQVTRTLRIGTAQMLALTFFNAHATGSTAQLVKATGVSRDPLVLALLAMAHPKVAVLLKRPSCKQVRLDDRWCLNFRYGLSSSPSSSPATTSFTAADAADAVVAVPPRLAGASARAVLATLDQREHETAVDAFRRNLTDSSIVREMKTRRVMTDERLFDAVSSHLADTHRVVVTRPEFAARVKVLIADQYLEPFAVPLSSSSSPLSSPPPDTRSAKSSFSLSSSASSDLQSTLSPPAANGYRYLT
jgi:hypothetical protein